VDAGHRVTIATGRSVPMTLPFIEELGIAPELVVCAERRNNRFVEMTRTLLDM